MMATEARIEQAQATIEADIRERLHNMQSVNIDTGRTLDESEVVAQMHTMDPDRFVLAIYLTNQGVSEAKQHQGRQIMTELKAAAVEALIRKYANNIRAKARVVTDQTPEVFHVD